MKLKNIMLSVAVILSYSCTAFAEQAAADMYRQMLESGTYYLEYSIRMYDFERINPASSTRRAVLIDIRDEGKKEIVVNAKAGTDDTEDLSYRPILPPRTPGIVVGTMGMHTSRPLGTGFIYAVSNNGIDRLQTIKRIVKEKGHSLPVPIFDVRVGKGVKTYVTPRIMHKGTNYYRFVSNQPMFALYEGKSAKISEAIMLPENDINSPELDPAEGWWNIRDELALPKEFAIFFNNDIYLDCNSIVQLPAYKESFQRVIGKNEYECDRYAVVERDNMDDSRLSFFYDAMYQDGKLKLIQKYIVSMEGYEDLIEEIFVRKIDGQLPDGAFSFSDAIPVYAAGMGDADDFIGVSKQVGVLGGNNNEK